MGLDRKNNAKLTPLVGSERDGDGKDDKAENISDTFGSVQPQKNLSGSGFIIAFFVFLLNTIFFDASFSTSRIFGYCILFQAILIALDMFSKKHSDMFCFFLWRVATFNLGVAIVAIIFMMINYL